MLNVTRDEEPECTLRLVTVDDPDRRTRRQGWQSPSFGFVETLLEYNGDTGDMEAIGQMESPSLDAGLIMLELAHTEPPPTGLRLAALGPSSVNPRMEIDSRASTPSAHVAVRRPRARSFPPRAIRVYALALAASAHDSRGRITAVAHARSGTVHCVRPRWVLPGWRKATSSASTVRLTENMPASRSGSPPSLLTRVDRCTGTQSSTTWRRRRGFSAMTAR